MNGSPNPSEPPVPTPHSKSLLAIVASVSGIAAIYFLQDVLIPVTLAVLLAFALSPLVTVLERCRLPRGPSVLLSVLAALSVVLAAGTLIGTQAGSLAVDAPTYARSLDSKFEGVASDITRRVGTITDAFARSRNKPASATQSAAAEQTGPQPVEVRVVDGGASPIEIARTILGPILGPIETLVIVLVIAIFVLLQKDDLRDRLIGITGSSDTELTKHALDDAGTRLSRYFLSQLAINSAFGVVIGIGLWIIGIPSPAMWGLLAGLLRFVPYIGSFMAALAPIALGAALEPGWGTALQVLVLFLVVEPLTGYVVEPFLYGHSTGITPVAVIVSAVFWTWAWGPIGLILSTPLTLCLVVLGQHWPAFAIFARLLGTVSAEPAEITTSSTTATN